MTAFIIFIQVVLDLVLIPKVGKSAGVFRLLPMFIQNFLYN